jgi:hypothetical protein
MKPVVYDFFCGLFGWGAAFLSQGYRVVGFDIADMHAEIGLPRPREVELVLQDVRSIHGSQCKDAAVLVASPPCQKYSYMAMPWKRAKALAAWYRESAERIAELNTLFDACFRIQREASEAAGRHIPLIVENVKGAQPWVGRAQWHFGSFYLWGDIPALMPIATSIKVSVQNWCDFAKTGETSPHWRMEGLKTQNYLNIRDGHSHTRHLTNPVEHVRIDEAEIKMQSPGHYLKPGSGPDWYDGGAAKFGSNSMKRKAASAQIAKIPFPLAQHVAQCFKEVRA